MQLITNFQTFIRQLLLMGVMLAVAGITALEAQTISVTNFYQEGSDLTPKQNPVEDQNGSRCALIRVQTTQKGFTFDVGSLGITKIEDDHDGEIWLWVPYGVRHISIRHEYLGSLPKYEFPIRIQKAVSYIMTIATDQQFINNFDKDRKQWLKVSVKAPNAQFTLNGMRVALDKKGCTEQEVHLGVHTYKVEAENFYPKEGQVSIVDPDKPTELVIVDLKPIMSKLKAMNNCWLSVESSHSRSPIARRYSEGWFSISSQTIPMIITGTFRLSCGGTDHGDCLPPMTLITFMILAISTRMNTIAYL